MTPILFTDLDFKKRLIPHVVYAFIKAISF